MAGRLWVFYLVGKEAPRTKVRAPLIGLRLPEGVPLGRRRRSRMGEVRERAYHAEQVGDGRGGGAGRVASAYGIMLV